MTAHATTLKTYWATWGALLALTLIMIVLDQAPMSRLRFLAVVLTVMIVKAALIAGTFMHLRFERVALVIMIVVGLLVNAAILFGLIVPDAFRIWEMNQ